MVAQRPPIRIGVVQFWPELGQVEENIERARQICAKLEPRSIDLLCLPEMIFTGYVFPNAAFIRPYLEEPQTGPTSKFCAEMAKRLHCYVTAGYPELLKPSERVFGFDLEGNEVEKIGANSAALYGPGGEWVGGYRKTNLFQTDMSWAKPGTGFTTFSLPSPLDTMSMGICMDLNPQPPADWTLAERPYEIADYCLTKGTRVLVLLNAWLDSKRDEDDEVDKYVMNYWAARLRPLWVRPPGEGSEIDGSDNESVALHDHEGDETIVICCNRCGEDNGTIFAGSSAVFSCKRGSGRPKLLHAMGREDEGVEVWTV
ncbi:hypothetical protein JAAARDRAFT_30627 [Jaapia argillacea MUCL 33604]|uniref:CN hydrolase domain-containing protein n=1 Tax=Jaapia argillacea MUCL 33604 TaxID=933084 RepID=A0A067QJC6_9AGAM|nr:hypothetical protein JAAARDRAFT_30627 [Jaapia argillacea MUCL 33604]